ncbi:Ada metal-binding domain-containing protein [Mucilaginibacter gracilis]|nr:Ada metal-binding domain-containing protein [Mucilaginibacter gracilis]
MANAKNRVFFVSEAEAIDAGYRPCGHCMRNLYAQWKEQHK